MRGWLTALTVAVALAASADAAGPRLGEKLPNGGRPSHRVAFPPIRDWRSLRITLRRTMCFGACPAYTVEIAGDGTVAWQGGSNVAALGARAGRVSQADMRRLYRAFAKAEFFWLFNSYRAPITDLPEYSVTLAYDGREKSVVDYAGAMIGMPRDVVALEQLIDKTAHTERWIRPAP